MQRNEIIEELRTEVSAKRELCELMRDYEGGCAIEYINARDIIAQNIITRNNNIQRLQSMLEDGEKDPMLVLKELAFIAFIISIIIVIATK